MFLRAVVAQKGLRERVHLLGPRQGDVPRLLKTLDLYLDTFPRPGGQSILEAMCAEVPVVAMRRTRDKAIDALGVGPTSSTVETLLPPEAELAEAEDVAGYARIALEYLRDPAKRRRVGAALRDFTRTRHERTGWFDRLEYYVREAVAAHCPAAVTEAITVSAS
jgi:glycosyltransferase involved in cell wall biosynthesis